MATASLLYLLATLARVHASSQTKPQDDDRIISYPPGEYGSGRSSSVPSAEYIVNTATHGIPRSLAFEYSRIENTLPDREATSMTTKKTNKQNPSPATGNKRVYKYGCWLYGL